MRARIVIEADGEQFDQLAGARDATVRVTEVVIEGGLLRAERALLAVEPVGSFVNPLAPTGPHVRLHMRGEEEF